MPLGSPAALRAMRAPSVKPFRHACRGGGLIVVAANAQCGTQSARTVGDVSSRRISLCARRPRRPARTRGPVRASERLVSVRSGLHARAMRLSPFAQGRCAENRAAALAVIRTEPVRAWTIPGRRPVAVSWRFST
ncbi:hypothetical protein [Lysobacter gummosus]|uniref:hypothetical protein n=1 Tax=Lysobacter gummosus TaxID=262324 RepID=UPI00362EA88B